MRELRTFFVMPNSWWFKFGAVTIWSVSGSTLTSQLSNALWWFAHRIRPFRGWSDPPYWTPLMCAASRSSGVSTSQNPHFIPHRFPTQYLNIGSRCLCSTDRRFSRALALSLNCSSGTFGELWFWSVPKRMRHWSSPKSTIFPKCSFRNDLVLPWEITNRGIPSVKQFWMLLI